MITYRQFLYRDGTLIRERLFKVAVGDVPPSPLSMLTDEELASGGMWSMACVEEKSGRWLFLVDLTNESYPDYVRRSLNFPLWEVGEWG